MKYNLTGQTVFCENNNPCEECYLKFKEYIIFPFTLRAFSRCFVYLYMYAELYPLVREPPSGPGWGRASTHTQVPPAHREPWCSTALSTAGPPASGEQRHRALRLLMCDKDKFPSVIVKCTQKYRQSDWAPKYFYIQQEPILKFWSYTIANVW